MAQMVSTEARTLAEEMFQKVFNEKNLEEAHRLLAKDVEVQLFRKHLSGIDEYTKTAEQVIHAFPDVKYELFDFVCEGKRVAFRWEGRGTHKGELWGAAPTNKKLAWNGMSIFEIEAHKIKRAWIYSNLSDKVGARGPKTQIAT